MSDMVFYDEGAYDNEINTGLQLAESEASEGGWKEYFDEDEGLGIEDAHLRAQTALMLENHKQWVGQLFKKAKRNEKGRRVMQEDTVSSVVSGFTDYLFPIVRAAFPTNPIHDLVSVQVTTKRQASIIYWNWIYGSTKGEYHQGQKLADANRGRTDGGFNYSSEQIENEVLESSISGNSVSSPLTLTYHSGGGIRPNTVAITVPTNSGDEIFYDDGNGGFYGGNGSGASIDYVTSQVTDLDNQVSNTPTNGSNVTVTYRWNSEGSPDIPEVSVQIETQTVETERRALQLNYSTEAAQDASAELGVNLESQLVMGTAEQLNYEMARQILYEMWTVAPVVAEFSVRPASNAGYVQQDHFRDIVYPLNQAANRILNMTQKAYPNWVVVDDNAGTLVESLPSTLFEAAPRPDNVQGVHYIGKLMGKFSVYKDIFLNTFPGASADGNFLMGYKGNDFFDAGFVWAPFRLFYTTDTLTLASFLSQKGLAARYATKMVNPHMYAIVKLRP